jgi:hypothetical protein
VSCSRSHWLPSTPSRAGYASLSHACRFGLSMSRIRADRQGFPHNKLPAVLNRHSNPAAGVGKNRGSSCGLFSPDEPVALSQHGLPVPLPQQGLPVP